MVPQHLYPQLPHMSCKGSSYSFLKLVLPPPHCPNVREVNYNKYVFLVMANGVLLFITLEIICQNFPVKATKLRTAHDMKSPYFVGLRTMPYIDGYTVPSDGHGTHTIRQLD
jgi:hypothetical protein